MCFEWDASPPLSLSVVVVTCLAHRVSVPTVIFLVKIFFQKFRVVVFHFCHQLFVTVCFKILLHRIINKLIHALVIHTIDDAFDVVVLKLIAVHGVQKSSSELSAFSKSTTTSCISGMSKISPGMSLISCQMSVSKSMGLV